MVDQKPASTKVAPISAQEKALAEKAQTETMQTLLQGLAKRRGDIDKDNPIAEKLTKSDEKKPVLGAASPTGLVNKMGALLGGFFTKKVASDASKAQEVTPAAETKVNDIVDGLAVTESLEKKQTVDSMIDGIDVTVAASKPDLVSKVLDISKGTEAAKDSTTIITETLDNFVDGLNIDAIQSPVSMDSIIDGLTVDAAKPASKGNIDSLIDGLSVAPTTTGPVLMSTDVLEQPSIFPTDHTLEQAQPKPEVTQYQQAVAAVDTAYSEAKAFKANAAIDAKLWSEINPKDVAIQINTFGENPAAKKAEALETKDKAQEALNAKLKEAHTAIFGEAKDAKTDVDTIKQALGEKIDAT